MALDQEPVLLSPARGRGGGLVLTGSRRGPAARGQAGSPAPGVTEEQGRLVAIAVEQPVDAAVRARARQIAARLAVPSARRDASSAGHAGPLTSVAYRGDADDIDLDRTLEVLTERPVPDDEDIIVRARVRARRAVVLAVDVSGSMRGERVRTAAATVGALAGELVEDDLGAIAFWSDAAVLLHRGDPVRPLELLDTLLGVPAKGLTNIAFALDVARRELTGARAADARVLLLSDCMHNAGPDPRPTAARLPRLDILLDVTGEHDVDLGWELARLGGGRVFQTRTHRDVAPALGAAFG